MAQSSPKIALLVKSLQSGGGVEKNTLGLAEAFRAAGGNVFLLSENFTKNIDPMIQCVRIGVEGESQSDYNKACSNYLSKNPFQVVFSMDRFSEATHIRLGLGIHKAYLSKRRSSKRRQRDSSQIPKRNLWERLRYMWGGKSLRQRAIELISYCDAHWNPKHVRLCKAEKLCLQNPQLEKVFTNSEMVKDEAMEFYQVPEEKICVVHNGAEWDEMEQDFQSWIDEKARFCEKEGIDVNRFQLLFVGSGFERKGLRPLLQGLSRLQGRNFFLHVVGYDRNQKAFERLTHKLGLFDHVKFYSRQKSARPFYQVADAVCIPSYYDPCANVTVEALAMGCFVLTATGNGGHEILNPATGYTIDDIDSPEEFQQGLEATLSHQKTWNTSKQIRDSVKHLRFENQLSKIVAQTLKHA